MATRHREEKLVKFAQVYPQLISESPTRIICILNGYHTGLVGKISYEDLCQIYHNGTVFVALGLSFAFVEFQNEKDAENALAITSINQKEIWPYYVTHIPKEFNHNICDYTEIPGLYMFPTVFEEEFDRLVMDEVNKWQFTKINARSVKHFGKEFDYGSNQLKKMELDFPEVAMKMLEMYESLLKDEAHEFDQLTVNKYNIGDGIPPHIDMHRCFGDVILICCFGAGAILEFSRAIPDTTKPYKEKKELYVPGRSIVVLSKESRFAWTHSIRSRTIDVVNGKVTKRGERVSFTFRSERTEKCKCGYTCCDDR